MWEGGTAQNSSQKFLSRGVESTVQSHTMQFLSISRTYPEGQCFAAVERNLVKSTKQIICGSQWNYYNWEYCTLRGKLGPGAQLSGAQFSEAQFSVNPPEAVQLLLLRVLERQCSAATIGVLWSRCSTAGHHHPRHMGAALTAQPFSRSNTAFIIISCSWWGMMIKFIIVMNSVFGKQKFWDWEYPARFGKIPK